MLKILWYGILSSIGYIRVICALYAFTVARTHPFACVISYLIGFICDELDGRFARKFNQISEFGVVLDMVTDRLSTAGLFVILSMLYPNVFVIFILLLMLDIFSHWSHMYYVLKSGKITHKEVTSKSWLVRTYYKYRWFMGICCISCEVLYLSLYMLHWPADQHFSISPIAYHHLQTTTDTTDGAIDRISIFLFIAMLSLPGFFAKQIINVVQLKSAMICLARFEHQSNANNKNSSKN